MTDYVVLVDENNNDVGVMEKMQAHREAKLHRAFSVFVFNSQGDVLLQQRALSKYHCGGLWTNSCCSHPRKDEDVKEAAHRRLKEELGFDCEIKEKGMFIYKAEFDNGLTEHELDHVFVGVCNTPDLKLDPEEVASTKWIGFEELKEDVQQHPEKYTPWFKIILEKFEALKD